ncbi:hypothetical protein Bpfe_020219 [Biomphalaria pfeifferi]|uniref:Uncharacterized protein n=1 Tax=Biomphalaria pfeifferi TaxID=112525 RepID=A0AAD8B921_BIOPF|nr:hypothetical protein Bpfe_020219 [Biomphalaria pfeifferi]
MIASRFPSHVIIRERPKVQVSHGDGRSRRCHKPPDSGGRHPSTTSHLLATPQHPTTVLELRRPCDECYGSSTSPEAEVASR